MIPKLGILYKCISTGKLRRYISFKNITDVFKIPVGIFQAVSILRQFRPCVVFSKGGYVSFPVIFAAYITKTPSVLHESDVSPGLANKLSARVAKVLCLSHYESSQYFPDQTKKIVTGNPVRDSVLFGNPENAYKMTHSSKEVPIMLVMGGSQGASRINEVVIAAAHKLVKHYQIIHICGKGKMPEAIPLPSEFQKRYKTFEYVEEMLADFYSIADFVVTRAGANTIAEIETLQIPAILVPLGKNASRGDQIINALVHKESHPSSQIIEDENFNYINLTKVVENSFPAKSFKKKQRKKNPKNGATDNIIKVLDDFLGEACTLK